MVDVQRLHEATADDVEAALCDSQVEAELAGVEPATLLEVWNRMVDQSAGPPED